MIKAFVSTEVTSHRGREEVKVTIREVKDQRDDPGESLVTIVGREAVRDLFKQLDESRRLLEQLHVLESAFDR